MTTLKRVREVFGKADAAVQAGVITQRERNAFLEHQFGSAHESEAVSRIKRVENDHRPVLLVTGFTILIVSFFAMLFYTTGGITGAVVFNSTPQNLSFAENGTLTFDASGANRLTLTGTARGAANIDLIAHHNGSEYLMHSYSFGPVRTPHGSLPRQWYVEGEPVTFNTSNASSIWLMDADAAIPLANTTIMNLSAGEYRIKLLINDTQISQEILPFTIAPEGSEGPRERFSTCGELCDIPLEGNITIEIVIEGNGSLALEEAALSSQENLPPLQVTNIPDLSGERISLNLSGYFTDANGDELRYDSSQHPGVESSINGSVLTISGTPGSYSYYVYASDLEELVQSNAFTVVLLSENATGNATDERENPPLNENASENRTANETIPQGLCDHPDPNKRPLECLQEDAARYFRGQTILKDARNEPVARINPLGNMVISGVVHEGAQFAARDGDYVISYETGYGETVATLWIDGETGDLYLKGSLHEEQISLEPQPGSYAVRNKQGITMLWVDPLTGDLYLKGNIVAHRGGLE